MTAQTTYFGHGYVTQGLARKDGIAAGWDKSEIEAHRADDGSWTWEVRPEALTDAQVAELAAIRADQNATDDAITDALADSAQPEAKPEPEAEAEASVMLIYADDGEQIGLAPVSSATGFAERIAASNGRGVVAYVPGTEDETFRVDAPAKPEPEADAEPATEAEPEVPAKPLTYSITFSAPAGMVVADIPAALAPVLAALGAAGFALQAMGPGGKAARAASTRPASAPRGPSGRDVMIELISRPEGASKAELMSAGGWKVQPDMKALGKAKKCSIAKRFDGVGFRYYAVFGGVIGQILPWEQAHSDALRERQAANDDAERQIANAAD